MAACTAHLCISRYTVMRCRGVRVTSRDGQLDSQNPHSMHLTVSDTESGIPVKSLFTPACAHLLTIGEAAGEGLSALMCASGS
jgi:hypothetical protein